MIYVFLAKGFEEIEALTAVDILRRAQLDVFTVGIGSKIITGSHNIPVFCDLDETEVEINNDIDAIVLPGGMPGTLNLEKNSTVNNAIDYCYNNNIYICAICAAPSILGHKGILKGKNACCFPGYECELEGATVCDNYVCVDGKLITAKGMGSSILFGREIVKQLINEDTAQHIIDSLQCPF